MSSRQDSENLLGIICDAPLVSEDGKFIDGVDDNCQKCDQKKSKEPHITVCIKQGDVAQVQYRIVRLDCKLFRVEVVIPSQQVATSTFYSGSLRSNLILSTPAGSAGSTVSLLPATGFTSGSIYPLPLPSTDAIRNFVTEIVSPSNAIVLASGIRATGTGARAQVDGQYLVRFNIGPIVSNASGIVVQLVRQRSLLGINGLANTSSGLDLYALNGLQAQTTSSNNAYNPFNPYNAYNPSNGLQNNSCSAKEVLYSATVPVTTGLTGNDAPYIALGTYVYQHTIVSAKPGDVFYLQLANTNASTVTTVPTILALSGVSGTVVASLTLIRIGEL